MLFRHTRLLQNPRTGIKAPYLPPQILRLARSNSRKARRNHELETRRLGFWQGHEDLLHSMKACSLSQPNSARKPPPNAFQNCGGLHAQKKKVLAHGQGAPPERNKNTHLASPCTLSFAPEQRHFSERLRARGKYGCGFGAPFPRLRGSSASGACSHRPNRG